MPETIASRIAGHAQRRADHPAIVDRDRVVSYRELNEISHRIATHLQIHGVESGDVVGIRARNSPEHFALMWAIARTNAIIYPIGNINTEGEVRNLAEAARVKVIIVDQDIAEFAGTATLKLDNLTDEKLPQRNVFSEPGGSARDLLYMTHSSGTTGMPKTFAFSQSQFAHMAGDYAKYLDWSPDDRFYLDMSMGDSWGGGLCLSMLQLGLTIVIARSAGIQHSIRNIQQQDITCLIILPWQLRQYLKYRSNDSILFPNVKSLVTSSSLLHPAERMLTRKYLTPHLFDAYGTTEFWHISMSTPEQQVQFPESVGKPLAGVELEIVDQNHLPLPTGSTGLIRVRAECMLENYYKDPDASARYFNDGYFYPMDLGYVNDEGYLFLQGRSDDVIQHRGAKFYPVEVTNLLAQYPGVEESYVFPWPDPEFGQVAAAAISSDKPIEQSGLDLFCAERMANYKIPLHYVFVNTMPRNRSGKVDVSELRRLLRQQLEECGKVGPGL